MAKKKRTTTNSSRQRIESAFPMLRRAKKYKIRSPETSFYNCYAWAVDDTDAWWGPLEGSYWPNGVFRDFSVRSLIEAYKTLGYVECNDESVEIGVMKIAIYGIQGDATHAAKQTADGQWSSKLGNWEDIEHELTGLTGGEYGQVVQILKKSIAG